MYYIYYVIIGILFSCKNGNPALCDSMDGPYVHYAELNHTKTNTCSVTQLCPVLCDSMDCIRPGFPVLHRLLESVQTHVCWAGDAVNHLILCCFLLLLPSTFPSIRVFSNELALCIRWPKYWSYDINYVES